MNCWLDGIFRVRVKLYSVCVSGGYGLSSSGSSSEYPTFKRCACYDQSLMRRELVSYTEYYLSVMSTVLVVIIFV